VRKIASRPKSLNQKNKERLPMSKPIPIDHEIDVVWIIAIWRAIHGGDPA
jgi:hypothetical protein